MRARRAMPVSAVMTCMGIGTVGQQPGLCDDLDLVVVVVVAQPSVVDVLDEDLARRSVARSGQEQNQRARHPAGSQHARSRRRPEATLTHDNAPFS